MYALMTVLAAGLEAGAGAVSRKVGAARRQRAISRAEPVMDAKGAGGTTSTAGATGFRGAGGAVMGRLREAGGRATAGPAGPVTAPFSGRSCVWYALTVRERYHAWRPGPLGPTKVVRHVRVAERLSGPLYITGDTADVRVGRAWRPG